MAHVNRVTFSLDFFNNCINHISQCVCVQWTIIFARRYMPWDTLAGKWKPLQFTKLTCSLRHGTEQTHVYPH